MPEQLTLVAEPASTPSREQMAPPGHGGFGVVRLGNAPITPAELDALPVLGWQVQQIGMPGPDGAMVWSAPSRTPLKVAGPDESRRRLLGRWKDAGTLKAKGVVDVSGGIEFRSYLPGACEQELEDVRTRITWEQQGATSGRIGDSG